MFSKIKIFIDALLVTFATLNINTYFHASDIKVEHFTKVIENLLKNYSEIKNIAILSSTNIESFGHLHNDITKNVVTKCNNIFTVSFIENLKSRNFG